MIFVVGGKCQGKMEYVKTNFPGKNIISKYQEIIWNELQNGENPEQNAESFLQKFSLEELENLVIISEEVGYGVVPIDKMQRTYRDCVGHVNQKFAEKASKVIRVVAGIGVIIK